MTQLVLMLLIFIFSFIIGYVLISRVPPLLHTPLMSMTNAISAVTILGALVLFTEEAGTIEIVLGASAIILAAFNIVGGFAITDRMLKLFKKKQEIS